MSTSSEQESIYNLRVLPNDQVITLDGKTRIMTALKMHQMDIKSSCGGKGACGDCKIKVVMGESNMSRPTFLELKLLGNVFHLTGERLSCQMFASGDLVVDISEHLGSISDGKNPNLEKSKKSASILRKKVKVQPGGEAEASVNDSRVMERKIGHRRPKRKRRY